MNFLDANIIAYAFYNNENQDKCQKLLKEEGITDTIALIEAFNILEYETNRENAIEFIKGLLKSNLKIIDVDLGIIFECLKRATKYKKLKFIDLVHYNVALISNCDTVMSYDKDFNGLELPRREA